MTFQQTLSPVCVLGVAPVYQSISALADDSSSLEVTIRRSHPKGVYHITPLLAGRAAVQGQTSGPTTRRTRDTLLISRQSLLLRPWQQLYPSWRPATTTERQRLLRSGGTRHAIDRCVQPASQPANSHYLSITKGQHTAQQTRTTGD